MSRYRNNTPYFTLGLIGLTSTINIVTWLNKFHRKITTKQSINPKINCVKIYKGPPFIAVFVIIIYSNTQGDFHSVPPSAHRKRWTGISRLKYTVMFTVCIWQCYSQYVEYEVRAAVKLWPKCWGLTTCLTATYRKEQQITESQNNCPINDLFDSNYNPQAETSEGVTECAAPIKCTDRF